LACLTAGRRDRGPGQSRSLAGESRVSECWPPRLCRAIASSAPSIYEAALLGELGRRHAARLFGDPGRQLGKVKGQVLRPIEARSLAEEGGRGEQAERVGGRHAHPEERPGVGPPPVRPLGPDVRALPVLPAGPPGPCAARRPGRSLRPPRLCAEGVDSRGRYSRRRPAADGRLWQGRPQPGPRQVAPHRGRSVL
jgi:hypothetical protein